MPTRNINHKIKLDESPGGRNNVNPARYHEIFVSSSKLISIYNEKIWHPPTDIFETEKDIIIRIEIAGMKAEEIGIQLKDGCLTVSGFRNEEDARIKRSFRQMEIEYGKFERVVEIHCGIEADKAGAAYHAGFLEIRLPKSKKGIPGPNSCGVITIQQITFR